MTTQSALIVGVLLLTGTLRIEAHHAFAAEFDPEQPVILHGAVTKVEWVNPHIWLYMDVKGSDGKVTNWAVEGGAPNALFRRGIRKNALPVNIVITVQGFRAKNGAFIVNGRDITWPDGIKLFMGTTGTGAPTDPK